MDSGPHIYYRSSRFYRRRRSGLHGMVFGLIILSIGVLLLLDNLNILRFHDVWRLWPVLLIAVGVAKLIDCYGVVGRVWGGLLTFAGVALLLNNLGYLYVDEGLIWPAVLIGLGLLMFVRAVERRRELSGPVGKSASSLGEFAVFGGTKLQVDSQDFQGGELLAVFGGVEADLRRAAIQKEEVVIDAMAMFGGVEIRVPQTWNVVLKGVGILGGYEDKTMPLQQTEAKQPPRVIVTGYAIFGGVTVTN